MSKLLKWMALAVVVAGVGTPAVASAAQDDPMACTIAVVYKANNVVRLTYDKDFTVDATTPFSDEFGNSFRFKFFDAWVTYESGVPVVSVSFYADVTAISAVDFATSLKVKDETHGETTEGNHSYWQSQIGTHNTAYTLTCKRAN